MGKFNWLIIIAVLVGGLVPVQSSINALLGSHVKTPMVATLINFLGGCFLVAIILVIFFKNEIPAFAELKQIPWYAFFGGIFGVIFVTTVVVLTPKIGVTNMLAGAIAGQLIISVIFDHFGWMNLPQHPITWQRLTGILLLIVGIIMSQK